MHKVSKEILDKYLMRKSRNQKDDFLEFYTKILDDNSIRYTIEEGGLFKHRNLIIGDLNKAKLIYSAHYDTAPKRILPFPFFIVFPNNMFMSALVEIILLSLSAFILTIFMSILSIDPIIVLGMVYVFIILVMFTSFIGPTNPHTYNDNTSGIITLNELILNNKLNNVAYVLFDNEEKGLLGSRFFAKKHKDILKDKLLVNLDCVSDGDHFMVLYNKSLRKNKNLLDKLNKAFKNRNNKEVYFDVLKYYPSDQMNFKNSIIILASNKMNVFGKYISRIHTPKDIIFDEENIKYLHKSLVDLAHVSL